MASKSAMSATTSCPVKTTSDSKTGIITSKEVLSILQCEVCHEYSIGFKIYVCSTGHPICQKCHPKLRSCPTCDGEPLQTRPLGLEKLADTVVVHCPFLENGCPHIVTGKEYERHSSTCSFR
jgi:hypothetical protein